MQGDNEDQSTSSSSTVPLTDQQEQTSIVITSGEGRELIAQPKWTGTEYGRKSKKQ